MTSEAESVGDGLTALELEEIHEQLRSVARGLLAESRAKGVLDWSVLVDSGWIGLEVPDAFGGAGVDFTETGIILTEMGRAASSSSYLGAAALGIGVLRALEPSAMRDQLLERVAAGTTQVAVVLPTADDAVGEPPLPFRLDQSTHGRLVLDGSATFVPDAFEADLLILFALSPRSGPIAVILERDSGLQVTPQPVLDSTRMLARVSAESLCVSKDVVLQFSDPATALKDVLDRGAAAMACDSVGIIAAMLDETVAYASAREQFGRAIGSFQAVKHACADMLVTLQISSELVGASTARLAEAHRDRSAAVSMAKSYVTEAAVQVAGKAVQLHGGIGYTWEAGLHVYQKRALLNRSLFGSPNAHRRRLAQRYT